MPIVFVYDGGRLLTPLDAKPRQVPASQLRRVRNLAANDRAAVVVDHYDEDWQQLAWMQLRGRAALLTDGDEYAAGLALLRQKYPQYATLSLAGRPLIRRFGHDLYLPVLATGQFRLVAQEGIYRLYARVR